MAIGYGVVKAGFTIKIGERCEGDDAVLQNNRAMASVTDRDHLKRVAISVRGVGQQLRGRESNVGVLIA
jgi:hypothetical protein